MWPELVQHRPIAQAMEEIAWAAGFFEAEGWAGAVPRPHGRYLIQLSISQYSSTGCPQVLTKFRSAMGGRGRVHGPFAARPTHYLWHAAGRVGVECLFALWPHLGSPKREQVARALGKTGLKTWSEPRLPTSMSWCAGLFDGDGSIGLIRLRRSRAPGRRGIHATVTQSSVSGIPEVLIHFHETIGGLGKINGPSRREGIKDVYRWQSQQPEVVRRVVDLLWPWLGPVKREQALSALRVIEAQPPLGRGGGHLGYRKSSCIRGHDYSGALLYQRISRNGRPYLQRMCRECRRLRDQAVERDHGPARGARTPLLDERELLEIEGHGVGIVAT